MTPGSNAASCVPEIQLIIIRHLTSRGEHSVHLSEFDDLH
jgi:hypothetical protein